MRKNTDANQGRIVQALRDVGATVTVLSQVGYGCPDLLVEFRRTLWLFEVKDGRKSPSKQRLTPAEKMFFDTWETPIVVRSVDDAIRFINEFDSPAEVPNEQRM
jgi:hypothetical protein